MSKERLERIKERVNYHGHLDDDIEWLIGQAERVEICELANKPISHKLANLNIFLQERNIGRWGESVIDNVVNHVEKLEGEIEGLLQTLEDREPYYSNLCLLLEKQNKRYKQALEFYADERNYKERDFGIIVQPAIQEGDRGNTARKALEGEE